MYLVEAYKELALRKNVKHFYSVNRGVFDNFGYKQDWRGAFYKVVNIPDGVDFYGEEAKRMVQDAKQDIAYILLSAGYGDCFLIQERGIGEYNSYLIEIIPRNQHLKPAPYLWTLGILGAIAVGLILIF